VFGLFDTICITGIILFTYHKYRKSMQSAIPLDSHGNLIATDDAYPDAADGERGYHVELEETARLTLATRDSVDFEEVNCLRILNSIPSID
jgi:solute carrier family 35 protein C2